MATDFRIAAVWVALAMIASLLACRLKQSVALIEILVGVAAGNLVLWLNNNQVFGVNWALETRPWLLFLTRSWSRWPSPAR
jgi:hypothetical protein